MTPNLGRRWKRKGEKFSFSSSSSFPNFDIAFLSRNGDWVSIRTRGEKCHREKKLFFFFADYDPKRNDTFFSLLHFEKKSFLLWQCIISHLFARKSKAIFFFSFIQMRLSHAQNAAMNVQAKITNFAFKEWRIFFSLRIIHKRKEDKNVFMRWDFFSSFHR